jgi:drug/metabolite transporter (DMT)-like permease
LGEKVSLLGFAGIFFIFAGAWMLNLETSEDGEQHGPLAPLMAIMQCSGSKLMLLVAIIYSVTSVGGKAAMQYMAPDLFGPFYFVLLGFITLVIFLIQRPKTLQALYRNPTPNIMIALFMAVMVITHFLALQQVEAAYMIAVKRSSMLFGILFGAILFNEKGLGTHMTAGGLMLAGVALIAFGSQ